MPRGRKKTPILTLDEQLENVQMEIDKATENLKALKMEKKSIQEKIAKKEKEDVYRMFLESGKSFEDLKGLLIKSEPAIETEE